MEVVEIKARLYQLLSITATGLGPNKMRSGNIEITFSEKELEIRAVGVAGRSLRVFVECEDIRQISRLCEFNIPGGVRRGIKIAKERDSAITIFEPHVVLKEKA